MPPKRLRRLTWDELDNLQAGQDMRRQKDMALIRHLAVQDYNMAVEKTDRLSAAQYMWLPAVDGPLQRSGTGSTSAGNEEWKARMKERYGDLLEG